MMNVPQETDKHLEVLWKNFKEQEQLDDLQEQQFRTYASLLQSWNEKFNITALVIPRAIIKHHFIDSLIARRFFDFSSITTCADVGSGGGFPGIPLKIAFPHLKVILLEVNKKKQRFLAEIIEQLKLTNIEICDLDWRTFLRTTEGHIDLFMSRASLDVDELCRLFKPSCGYRNAPLLYWAGPEWVPSKISEPFLKEQHPYVISHKKRKLVVLKVA